ncbi:MAG TPA: hypothetical protein VMX54_15605 [Vicinamibacteria bacterium]|nr:hypothetical protein [Vicinamibacteria bacterium]
MSRSPSRAAIHEAGHAVVALRCGLPVHQVTLKPPDLKAAGWTVFGTRLGAKPEVRAAVAAAGRLAEELLTGTTVLSYESDFAEMNGAAPEGATRVWFEDVIRKATAILRRDRDRIFALATALDRAGALGRGEIERAAGLTPDDKWRPRAAAAPRRVPPPAPAPVLRLRIVWPASQLRTPLRQPSNEPSIRYWT